MHQIVSATDKVEDNLPLDDSNPPVVIIESFPKLISLLADVIEPFANVISPILLCTGAVKIPSTVNVDKIFVEPADNDDAVRLPVVTESVPKLMYYHQKLYFH